MASNLSVPAAVREVPRAEPIVFGATDELFGWYHAPRPSGARPCAVVLCNSLGHEQASAHRMYKKLAEHLASAGFAAIRFDYPSTGDSAGEPDDPRRIAAAIESIRAAQVEARARIGVHVHVALFGMRIGALLARAAGADRIVRWSPVASGAAYARELRLIARAAEIPLEVSNETLAELAGLDAHDAPRVLDLGSDGWQEMMRDPHESIVPERILEKTALWLASSFPPAPSERPPLRASRALRAGSITEEPVFFDGLFGIVTLPAERATTGVVLASVGAFHRTGPGRLYVRLARALAAKGFAVLRFDLRGIGDSPAADGEAENVLYRPDAIEDVRAAIDELERRGVKRFVSIGVCSGAYASYETARVDPRVARLVLVNIPTFTWHFGDPIGRGRARSTHAYRRAAFQRETWTRLVRGEVHAREIAIALAARVGKRIVRAASGESDVAGALEAICARGTDVMLVYASDDPGLDEAELHLSSSKRLRVEPRFEIRRIDEGDHAFVSRAAQDKLTKVLVESL
jgi:alpha-beta hydrolase superfamily lysophospholipase